MPQEHHENEDPALFLESPAEEVQDIMGTPPRWIVRWGTVVIALVLLTFGAISYLVKYPDIVRAPLHLTTLQPPVNVVARVDGYLQTIPVKNGQTVKAGDLLLVLQSSANYTDVLSLEQQLQKLQDFDVNELADFKANPQWQLGELQTEYSAFSQTIAQYAFRKSSGFDAQSIGQLRRQIGSMQSGIKSERDKQKNLEDQLALEKRSFDRTKQNYTENNASLEELERARAKVIEAERQIKDLKSTINSKEQGINDINKEILGVQQGSSQGKYNDYISLIERMNQLKATLEKWKQQYIITAPIDGQVSFFDKLQGERQNVRAGEEIMAIVPDKQTAIVGRVELPLSGSGKVLVNQRVLLKFDSYPYQQFGIIEGSVTAKSLVPNNNDVYTITVSLPQGLKTSYNLSLKFDQQMQGTAEIITAERRFIERIFDPLVSAFRNR